ncbi:sugar phosphate isomerase/epimerase [Cellulomonas sp. PhB143]|uniref:sugar phosphate isomerase/epimerase family protein n=1 Tax=Cellulomonas sp. PhB143 TaxID=2485186 RepID=UPI000F464C00|nr:sugar phosphate isomerase/epimerase [Cellulomonas sp. PhB143]ROS79052.1 sugar phosphate isomerase/epimerase [Cellulomonas sp. PhB143]
MAEPTSGDPENHDPVPVNPVPVNPVTLSTASVYPERAEYAFRTAAELGYDGVEVMIWGDESTQDAVALQQLSDRFDVPIRSLHAPTLLVSQRVWRGGPAPKLTRTVDMAVELGARTVVVHPPFRWQRSYAAGFERQVHDLSRLTDVTVAVENMYPWRGGRREVVAYLPGWDPTEHGYEAVTLDLSHTAVAQQDALAMARAFGDRLKHLHLADGVGNVLDEHKVPGRGTQPCAEVLLELAQRGWAGDVVVEISTRKGSEAERRADLVESLRFAREHLAAGVARRGGQDTSV